MDMVRLAYILDLRAKMQDRGAPWVDWLTKKMLMDAGLGEVWDRMVAVEMAREPPSTEEIISRDDRLRQM